MRHRARGGGNNTGRTYRQQYFIYWVGVLLKLYVLFIITFYYNIKSRMRHGAREPRYNTGRTYRQQYLIYRVAAILKLNELTYQDIIVQERR